MLVKIKETRKKEKKRTYGPNNASCVVVWASLGHCHPFQPSPSSIEPKNVRYNQKKHNRNKSKLTYGPNDVSCVVWARLGHRSPFQPSPSSIVLNII